MSKGSSRREEDSKKVRENWPMGKTAMEEWLEKKEEEEKLCQRKN